jgi:uncharacterized protein YbjT (DUF2867 family)
LCADFVKNGLVNSINEEITMKNANPGTTLILGANGKTGRRIVQRLEALGLPVRIGSRSATPSFDWHNESNWHECLNGVSSVYINYAPDLAMPGATDSIRSLVEKAKQSGVQKLVLLSGRGEEEAQACERIVAEGGVDWTVVRASWFNQNFSEGAFIDMVLSGEITLPASETPEPFVDADDIADVAVAALTEEGHNGEIYEVSGPRLMTLDEVVADISRACGRTVKYIPVPHDAFINGLSESGAPKDVVWMLDYLFATVLDGRNAHLTNGVERALGRPPKDFAEYAREVFESDIWTRVG